MLGCPESPVHLAAKGKKAEAEEVAAKLWGPGGAAQLASAGECRALLPRNSPCLASAPAPCCSK